MNAMQLIPLVQQTRAGGQQYLRLSGHYVHIAGVFKWQSEYEEKLVSACELLKQYEANKAENPAWIQLRLRALVSSAAHDFCMYLRDLGLLVQSEEDWADIPSEVSSSPEFKEYWDQGFSSARAQLYWDPD